MSETLVFDDRKDRTRSARTYGGNDTHACGKSPNACGIAFDMDGLRAFLCERHAFKTAESVSQETGIPYRTVERWLSTNPSDPSAINMLRLFIAYRAPVLAAAMVSCPAWLNDEAIAIRNDEIDRRIDNANAQRAAVSRGDM